MICETAMANNKINSINISNLKLQKTTTTKKHGKENDTNVVRNLGLVQINFNSIRLLYILASSDPSYNYLILACINKSCYST